MGCRFHLSSPLQLKSPWVTHWRRLLLVFCLWAGFLWFWGWPSLFAQEETPAQTDHQLYLPVIRQSASPATVEHGHGEWPAGRSYTVRAEDTLFSVALEMGMDLADMNCLISPTFTWAHPLVIGDTLIVPELPFYCHTIQPGDTLPALAAQYGVDPESIRNERWNQLRSGDLISGHNVRIPAQAGPLETPPHPMVNEWTVENTEVGPLSRSVAEDPAIPADWPYGSGRFVWPTYGWLTQGYRLGHSALDIAAPAGTPVTAADRGVVIRAGWSSVGYGQFVVIDHKIDYLTLYAHLDTISVQEGQVVGKGQLIGTVGSTGNSTGPHLHFEIRDFGQRIDPLSLLPH